MAPVSEKSSQLVTARVTIAGIEVDALVDTGASTSCCRWGWYKRWKSTLGPLQSSSTVVVGVGNLPIEVKGLSMPLTLEWGSQKGHCELLVLSTLDDVDVILGMDVLGSMGVTIDAATQKAEPSRKESSIRLILKQNYKIPAGKSRVFFFAK